MTKYQTSDFVIATTFFVGWAWIIGRIFGCW